MAIIESTSRQGNSRRMVRAVAAGAAGLVLLGGAYNAAFAGKFGGGGPGGGYGPGPGGDDDDDGLSTGETVGIAVGGAALIAAAAGAFGGGLFAAGGAAGMALLGTGDCKILDPLPAGAEVAEIRLCPQQTVLNAGECRVFDLQAKSRADGKWYSVANSPNATIELAEASDAVVKQEGAKNVFCVPVTAPQTANNRSVVILGSYRPGTGINSMLTEARIHVRVGGELGVGTPRP